MGKLILRVMNIEKSDIIKVEYEGTFDDGTVFDSSKHGDHSHPLEFEVGAQQVIAGFDKAVIGMKEGERKKFVINPEEGYGVRDERFVKSIPRKTLPPTPNPEKGMTIMMNVQGNQVPGTITSVDKDSINVDFNHPLAGKRLHFSIEIVSIQHKDKEDNHAR